MFSIFKSRNDKKLRSDAENWLRLADKVYHYRRDLLSERELQSLTQASLDLRENLKKKGVESNKIKLAVDRLEDTIRRVGGSYYPKSALAENIEVLLVAAILAIGIRTYFVQPFKIPTNSMMPTYYGMTAEVFTGEKEEPGALHSVLRKALFGATRIGMDSGTSGVCRIPVNIHPDGRFEFPYEEVPDRKWLIFPTVRKEYTVLVGDQRHTFRVPTEFDIDDIYLEVFYPNHNSLADAVTEMRQRGRYRSVGEYTNLMETDREVEAGDRILAFDILTGDQLFVDRMSYHFKRPSVGESFVFRTGDIPGINNGRGGSDSYYIKRLVGREHDRLEVREPILYRNGEPINSKPVFEQIHAREGAYGGYEAAGMLGPGSVVEIPEDSYFAMGDNSANSQDSRIFGFVPKHAVVGRPILIYYPFTSRWGPAK